MWSAKELLDLTTKQFPGHKHFIRLSDSGGLELGIAFDGCLFRSVFIETDEFYKTPEQIMSEIMELLAEETSSRSNG